MAAPLTTLSLHVSSTVDLLELLANVVNPVDEAAPVDLELSLTRTSRANTARLLGQRPARATQPRQSVLQQREFHLGLALGGARVLRKDVENDRRAVNGRATKYLLQITLLGGRQILLEDHRVGVDREADLLQFIHLARAKEGGRIGGIATLHHARDHVGTSSIYQ